MLCALLFWRKSVFLNAWCPLNKFFVHTKQTQASTCHSGLGGSHCWMPVLFPVWKGKNFLFCHKKVLNLKAFMCQAAGFQNLRFLLWSLAGSVEPSNLGTLEPQKTRKLEFPFQQTTNLADYELEILTAADLEACTMETSERWFFTSGRSWSCHCVLISHWSRGTGRRKKSWSQIVVFNMAWKLFHIINVLISPTPRSVVPNKMSNSYSLCIQQLRSGPRERQIGNCKHMFFLFFVEPNSFHKKGFLKIGQKETQRTMPATTTSRTSLMSNSVPAIFFFCFLYMSFFCITFIWFERVLHRFGQEGN